MAASSSTGPQVFINYRVSDMGLGFLGFLVTALRKANIKVFTDRDEIMGKKKQNILVRIQESKVALAIFSVNYTSSAQCLDELVKINECVDQGTLIATPIIYKIETEMVENLSGQFGDGFRALTRSHLHDPERTQKWEKALTGISGITGKHLQKESDTDDEGFINLIVEGIQKTLSNLSREDNSSKEAKIEGEISGKQAREVNDKMIIPARELEITHSESPEKWKWSSIYEEPNSAGIEIATMSKVQWLKIVGKFETSDLTPGKEYEVVFMVKVDGTASGWESPVNLKLKLEPQGRSDSRGVKAVNLTKHRSHGWVNLRAGVFVAPAKNVEAKGTVTMSQYVTDDTKTGLVIKGVAILPTI